MLVLVAALVARASSFFAAGGGTIEVRPNKDVVLLAEFADRAESREQAEADARKRIPKVQIPNVVFDWDGHAF